MGPPKPCAPHNNPVNPGITDPNQPGVKLDLSIGKVTMGDSGLNYVS